MDTMKLVHSNFVKIIGFQEKQDPAARRATAAATRSVSRERLGLGTAIRILDEMKFPTLDEMNFPTHSEVDFDARFWQFFFRFWRHF